VIERSFTKFGQESWNVEENLIVERECGVVMPQCTQISRPTSSEWFVALWLVVNISGFYATTKFQQKSSYM